MSHNPYSMPLSGGILSGFVLKAEDFDASDRKGGRFDTSAWEGAKGMREKLGPVLPILVGLQSALVRARPLEVGAAALTPLAIVGVTWDKHGGGRI